MTKEKKKNKIQVGFNNYTIFEGYAIVYIKRRNGDIFEVKVDIEDIERLKKHGYSWHVVWDNNNKSWYARQSVCTRKEDDTWTSKVNFMHRWLVGVTEEYHVDHKNHDTLDNRKDNLRITIRPKNASNRKGANSNNKTGVRNVHLVNRYGGKQLYMVQIMKNGERYKWEFGLNEFEKACKFAEIKRKELFGEFSGNG